MKIRLLTINEILIILSSWAGAQRVVFQSVDEIAGLLKRVDRVLVQIRQVQASLDAESSAEALTALLDDADDRHDWTVRSIWEPMSGAISRLRSARPVDTGVIARIEALRDKLFPAGLATVGLAYADEAGASRRMIDALDETDRAQLRTIPVYGEGNLLDRVQALAEVGLELEAIERRRSVLSGNTSSRQAAHQARIAGWQVIDLVLTTLEDAEATPEVLTALRQPVIDQVQNAERRYAQRMATARKRAEGDGADASAEEGAVDAVGAEAAVSSA